VILQRDFSMRHYSVNAGLPRIQTDAGNSSEKCHFRLRQSATHAGTPCLVKAKCQYSAGNLALLFALAHNAAFC
jgi:hypothetical protein